MHNPYSKSYTSALIRGQDVTAKPALTQEIAKDYAGIHKKLLDIGCGTGEKGLSLAQYYQTIVGLEPSHDLLTMARQNIIAKKVKNCHVIDGVAEKLPFKINSFGVAMSILSWWNASEVFKVLQPNGIFLIECLGPKDKSDFTIFFGEDNQGLRGANLNTHFAEIKQRLEEKLLPYFEIINLQNVKWKTSYKKEGLWLLLNNTVSTVRNFHPVTDKSLFDEAVKQLEVENHIVLTQNRLIVVARRLSKES